MTVVRGLDNIVGDFDKKNWVKLEDGEHITCLIIDWYENLRMIAEHYVQYLTPRYIRCPGQSVCPLCLQGHRPNKRVKFRIYDPSDGKIKFMSLAPKHIKSLHLSFKLDNVDPTKEYVTIFRNGKTSQDTTYQARPVRQQLPLPDLSKIEMPDIEDEFIPHTPEQIQSFLAQAIAEAEQGEQVKFDQPTQQQFNIKNDNTQVTNVTNHVDFTPVPESPRDMDLPF